MLDKLRQFESVEQAAKEMAGNYKVWSCFMWLGEDDVPDSENVMLGYTTGPSSTITDLANAEVIAKALSPFMGDISEDGLVDELSSSVSGDRNVLQGFSVRVYKDGMITEPFKILYNLAQQRSQVLDEDVFDKVNRREMLRYVKSELPDICEDQHRPYSDVLAEQVVDVLVDEEGIDFDLLDREDIERILPELD